MAEPASAEIGESSLSYSEVRPRKPWYITIFRYKGIVIGGAILLSILFAAIFAPVLTAYDPSFLEPSNRLSPPTSEHRFGTDNFGRDIYSLTLYGARVSLLVGLSVALLSVLGGAFFGLLAGYYPKIDTPLMRVMDAMMAFPDIVLAVGIMAVIGAQVSNVIIALTVVITPRLVRLVRSAVITLRNTQYVDVAHSIGATDRRILIHHILPNCVSPLIVQGTFIFGAAVLEEAALSFLGMGAPPDVPTWGNILGEGRMFIRHASHILVFPGIALSLTVLSLNLIGDGVRDFLDPRLR